MPAIDTAVEFEVFCSCGAHMCNKTSERTKAKKQAKRNRMRNRK